MSFLNLTGRFAIGARVALLWQHNAKPSLRRAAVIKINWSINQNEFFLIIAVCCACVCITQQWHVTLTARLCTAGASEFCRSSIACSSACINWDRKLHDRMQGCLFSCVWWPGYRHWVKTRVVQRYLLCSLTLIFHSRPEFWWLISSSLNAFSVVVELKFYCFV